MGGRVFEGTVRATKDVRNAIEAIFVADDDLKGRFKWIGSSALNKDSYGDLDVAIQSDAYFKDQEAADHVREILQKETSEEVEYRKIGDTHFYKIWDTQLDVTFVNILYFQDWIGQATTVSEFDAFKALYRNEILFAAVKYLFPTKIKSMRGSRILEFERHRYTLDRGIVVGTYSYRSSKTGNFVSIPELVDEKTSKVFQWAEFKKAFGMTLRQNFDFVDVLRVLEEKFSSLTCYEIIDEVIDGLTKKQVEIPSILFDLRSKYYPSKV